MDLDFQDPEASIAGNERISTESTTGEALRASYALSEMDSTTQSVMDITEMSGAKSKGGPNLSPDELNLKYPGMDKPFIEPMADSVASIVHQRAMERKTLADTIAKGPEGGFYGLANFGAALLPHALDPINVGSGLLLSEGIGYVAKLAEAGSIATKIYGVAKAARIAAAVHKGGLVGTFAEGVAGNLITEPLTMIAANQDGRDYTTGDFLMNTVGGAAFLPAIVHGGKYALKGVHWGGDVAISQGTHFLNRIDPQLGDAMRKSSIARYLADKKAHPDLFIKDAVKAIDGDKPKWATTDYEYSKIDVAGGQGERRLFVSTYDKNLSLKESFIEAPTEHAGYGIYATDRPEVANGAASRRGGEAGQVVEVRLNDDFKMLDADQFHGDIKIDGIDISVEGKSLTQIIDEARHLDMDDGGSRLEKIQKHVTDQGYDGITYTRSNSQGVDLSTPHNEVLVFNDKKVSEVGRIDPDTKTKGTIDSAEMEKVYQENTEQSGHYLVDEETQGQLNLFDEDIKVPQRDPKVTELTKLQDEKLAEIKDLESQGLLDADDLRQLELVKQSADLGEIQLTAKKMAAACLGVV